MDYIADRNYGRPKEFNLMFNEKAKESYRFSFLQEVRHPVSIQIYP